ncbi:arylamine N-acetyltransferase family protein [Amycolatopsis sp. cmx-4-54]|uniref:arylamine N-acetyltransferase family protein n=1 Tax=Amycolatopsis sp. cmx-4-54 TaxID=2790936 RepID=UPI00397DC441
MTLDAFLDRLEYREPVRPDPATLRSLHRAWRLRVPYENLDLQLGRKILLDQEALAEKFTRRGRGGLCYEMNGALALLLRAAGFEVTVVEAAVLRSTRGEGQWGNHIALLVDVGGATWLADTGIGDAFLEPLPVREGTYRQGELLFRIERLDGETWRMHHHPGGTVDSCDFRTVPREVTEFAERDEIRSPESPFARVLVAQHHRDGRELALRARTLKRGDGERHTLSSLDEFAETLREFRIPVEDIGAGELAALWAKTEEQHEAWLAIQTKSIDRG